MLIVTNAFLFFARARTVALLTAGVWLACAAHADTVTITGSSTSPLATGSEPLKIGNANSTPNMGEFTISSATQSYQVYCLDPLRTFTNQTYTTISLSNFLSTTNIAGSGALTNYQKEFTDTTYVNRGLTYNTATPSSSTVWGVKSLANASTVLNNLTALYSHAFADSLKDATHSQGFQYAVWEVLLDQAGAYSTSAANLQIGSGAVANFSTIAAGYLSALNTGSWASVYDIGAGSVNLSAVTNYNYTVFIPGSGGQIVMAVNQVPEPGALSLAMIALAGLAYTSRRNARGASAA